MNQLFPFFDENSSNGDYISGLFLDLNSRINDGLQSITIHESKIGHKRYNMQ
jgi:hypothetical protein